MAMSGPRPGVPNTLRRLLGRAVARDLRAFVVPGVECPRLAGIDLRETGLRVVETPRHASVLLLAGHVPEGLEHTVAVVYAQIPRPRAILRIGETQPAALPEADVVVEPEQTAVANGIVQLRRKFATSAFSPITSEFGTGLFRARTEYTCPMHPEVVADEPGQCPICGMDLVPREAEVERQESHEMHGMDHRQHQTHAEHTAHDMEEHHGTSGDVHAHEGTSTDQAGQRTTDEPRHGDKDGYTCPMHPEVIQSHPGTCPICHMRLVPRASLDAEESSQMTGSADHGGHDHEHDHHPGDGMGRSGDDEAAHKGHQTENMDHGEHAGHGGGGFMSMVAMTSDLPRSRDGLPMEWLEASFGPLFPGLPGGLAVTLTLDGDMVAKAEIRGGTCRRALVRWEGSPHDLPTRLANFDRLAPGAYARLAQRALDSIDRVTYVQALEQARVVSHLNWLASYCFLLGLDRLATEATDLLLAIVRAPDTRQVAALVDPLTSFTHRVEATALLERRLRGVGRFDLKPYAELSGPVARAAGLRHDARADDPAYQALDFTPVVEQDNDALARLRVRLAEIRQSVEVILASGGLAGRWPGWDRTSATSCEMPRGRATLVLEHQPERVKIVRLDTPSSRLAGLVNQVTVGHEVADALVAIASLDLSPWEVDG